MSYQDIYDLWKKDKDGIVKHKSADALKAAHKLLNKTFSNEWTYYKPLEFKSASGISYILQPINCGRNVPKKDRIGCNLIGYFINSKGLHFISEITDADGTNLWVYIPHFLNRYRERFVKDATLDKIQLIKDYIRRNKLNLRTYIKSTKYPDSYYAIINDGLCLCTDHGKGIIEVKTFLTWDMLGEDQDILVKEARAFMEQSNGILNPQAIPQEFFTPFVESNMK